MMRLLAYGFEVLLVLVLGVNTAETAPLADIVRHRVVARYDLDTSRYTVEITRSSLKTESARPEEVRVRPLTQGKPSGPMVVVVELHRDGRLIERGQVRLMVRRFDDVLVTTRRIGRHERLTADMFEKRRMETTSLREQPVTALDSLSRYRSSRNLPTGKVLTTSAIEPVPDIEVGREVSIVYDNGLFTITVPGRVLQDGIGGEYVRVKNLASGKIVMARVVDARAVAVDP